ncbi:MAG TPA: prohibitin family protein [Nitrososphaeraceae archaeon]
MSYDRMPGIPRINKSRIVLVVIPIIVIIFVMVQSVVIVEAGHRGVVLYLGAVENRVLPEGVHFIIPFVEKVVQMEVRTQKFQAESSAASNDLQEVETVIALNYRLDPNEVNKVYQLLGENYADRLISPTIQESVKASIAKFNAEELITKRETAKDVIGQAIKSTLTSNDILVENVFITDFKFSPAFSTQIEQKVVALQKYLTEQNNLRSIQVVANQTVVQAEAAARSNVAKASGEAKAIEIISSQLKSSPEYLQWQSINRWNGKLPYASGENALPFFQLPVPQINTANQTNQAPEASGQTNK